MPGLHVGQGIGHRLLLALADEGREPFLGPGELEKDEEVPVVVEPGHRRTDARLDPPDGVGLVGHGLALGAPQVALGVGQDLPEELLLGGEVPVEDALAHAEAVDDVGHRRRVVAVGGERWAAKSVNCWRRLSPRAVNRRATASTLRGRRRGGQ